VVRHTPPATSNPLFRDWSEGSFISSFIVSGFPFQLTISFEMEVVAVAIY
jgi:hypothetical protein